MTALNRSTCRRLQKLPQTSDIWEGDRRTLSPGLSSSTELEAKGECILWVDGVQAIVRAMDVVTPETGIEAIVRTLLRAMESPHSPAVPSRPQKIVVRDREIQFFLRGVLQDLDIAIDYASELPLINEIFRGLQEVANARPPELPPQYAEALMNVAYEIWHDAPWELLDEQQIISIKLNQWDIDTFYISILGMLGVEYGILMYRSLDSLKQFRQRVLTADESPKQLQQAFLEQDCLFLTFERSEDDASFDENEEPALGLIDSVDPSLLAIEPVFGALHPLEGLRAILYDEEAIAALVALEALHRFLQAHQDKLGEESFPAISSNYRIPNPLSAENQHFETQPSKGKKAAKQTVAVTVATMPDLADQLFEMVDEEELENAFTVLPSVRDDLIPDNSMINLKVIDWETIQYLRQNSSSYYQAAEIELPTQGEGLPIVLIQTSQPKAKALIQSLQTSQGLQAICFNPGADPLSGNQYDIGLLQTTSQELQMFGEYLQDDPAYTKVKKKWDQGCKKAKGYCGLIVAKGITGIGRGNPQPKDMLALFEVRSLSPKELGLGPLEMRLEVDWV